MNEPSQTRKGTPAQGGHGRCAPRCWRMLFAGVGGAWMLMALCAVVTLPGADAATLRVSRHRLRVATQEQVGDKPHPTLHRPADLAAAEPTDPPPVTADIPVSRNRSAPAAAPVAAAVPPIRTGRRGADDDDDDDADDGLWLLGGRDRDDDKPSGWGWLADSVRASRRARERGGNVFDERLGRASGGGGEASRRRDGGFVAPLSDRTGLPYSPSRDWDFGESGGLRSTPSGAFPDAYRGAEPVSPELP